VVLILLSRTTNGVGEATPNDHARTEPSPTTLRLFRSLLAAAKEILSGSSFSLRLLSFPFPSPSHRRESVVSVPLLFPSLSLLDALSRGIRTRCSAHCLDRPSWWEIPEFFSSRKVSSQHHHFRAMLVPFLDIGQSASAYEIVSPSRQPVTRPQLRVVGERQKKRCNG
jgi:hypothetical protein